SYHAKNMVYNLDDENHAYMCGGVPSGVNMISYSIESDGDFTASDIRPYRAKTSLGIDFDVMHRGVKTGIRLRTPGYFSVYNALAAIAVCSIYGVSQREASDCLKTVSIRGRSEIVDAIEGITFIIDYAHNGLSLTDELTVLRSYEPKRLICVFGCIGGRTYGRRKELAEASGELADFTVITSDNPDNEDPDEIIEDVLRYFDKSKPYTTITDREEAVRFAVRIASEGDIVLFAGKGHENYQLINGEKVPFSERSIILNEAARIGGKVAVGGNI
ncbi:MAG: glutamate ligase domain-containing protein, partial [Eubacteriales bacterium]